MSRTGTQGNHAESRYMPSRTTQASNNLFLEKDPFNTRLQSDGSLLFLQPWNPRYVARIFSNSHNFYPESAIQALRVSDKETSWLPRVSDDDLTSLLEQGKIETLLSNEHTLLVLVIHLEFEPKAEFQRQASISRGGLKRLIDHIQMHDAAVQDLLGRPDYWSAFGRRKEVSGERTAGYEFFCQHPRWLQKSRYDKLQHRAPCSVYLHHDGPRNISYYIMSAARNDGSVAAILDELGIPESGGAYSGPSIEAASNPFLIHAILSGHAYHQSVTYMADLRERLFSQIAEVNDYSKESHEYPSGGRGDAGRQKLESITKSLHLVSQTCDTGIANANMSIKVCEAMVHAYIEFVEENSNPPETWRQVPESMKWILETWHCQKNWLVSYKARKDTAMNFVYNLVTQQDSSLNIDIAHQSAQHSSSMNTITILTMLFLPGTFLAGLFGSGILEKDTAHGISDLFLPFIYCFIPLTVCTIALWMWRQTLQVSWEWLLARIHSSG